MENKIKTLEFGKYTVTLDLFEEDGEQRAFCDIENNNTLAAASLALAQDSGCLYTLHGDEEAISERITSQIEKWAIANGY